MPEQRYGDAVRDIINDASDNFDIRVRVEEVTTIPINQEDYPLEQTQQGEWRWLRILGVVCVFIDMKNSTRICADSSPEDRASVYQFFTDTAVRILDEFGASYIDIKGDGAFGLFNGTELCHAIAAAITFKTFVNYEMKTAGRDGSPICCHIGVHKDDVLVKRLGLRQSRGKVTTQNEVWAGNPVNMAAKLAALGKENDLLISKPVYQKIKNLSDVLTLTCGCPKGDKSPLWKSVSLQSEMGTYGFPFNEARRLNSNGWCDKHGSDFCEAVCKLDQ